MNRALLFPLALLFAVGCQSAPSPPAPVSAPRPQASPTPTDVARPAALMVAELSTPAGAGLPLPPGATQPQAPDCNAEPDSVGQSHCRLAAQRVQPATADYVVPATDPASVADWYRTALPQAGWSIDQQASDFDGSRLGAIGVVACRDRQWWSVGLQAVGSDTRLHLEAMLDNTGPCPT